MREKALTVDKVKRGKGVQPRPAAAGSGVVAGPAIRHGWGRHTYGDSAEISGARTPARTGRG